MITKGEGALGRIYERLRKRSYRLHSWPGIGLGWHSYYVRGVKDALKAVDRDLTGIYYEERLRNGKTLVSGR